LRSWKLIDSALNSLYLVGDRLLRKVGRTKEHINVTLGIARRGLQRHALPVLHPRRHAIKLEELVAPLNVSHDAVDELILGNFRKRIVDQNWSTHLKFHSFISTHYRNLSARPFDNLLRK